MPDEYEAGHPSATILVLHDADLDPGAFLSRIIGRSDSVSNGANGASSPEEDAGLTPWLIENKYYTAPVSFRSYTLDRPLPDPHPVVLYLFSGAPLDPLPPALTRLSVADPAPDVALAVRLNSSGGLSEADEERFDELGFELVDEGAEPEDDDERHPLETVRQTLMTHMWPTMVRKAPARQTAGAEQRHDSRPAQRRAQTMEYATFPVTFGSGASAAVTTQVRPAGPASDFPEVDGYAAVPQDPSHALEEEDDEGEFGEFSGLGGEEYARLDEWLDGEEEPMPVVRGDSNGDNADQEPAGTRDSLAPSAAAADGAAVPYGADAGFEDDFGPSPSAGHDEGEAQLPLDPTPILLHLQNVRAELADVDDEDERRVRAGAEVARLMRSLGLGGDDLGLDELEFDELELEMPTR